MVKVGPRIPRPFHTVSVFSKNSGCISMLKKMRRFKLEFSHLSHSVELQKGKSWYQASNMPWILPNFWQIWTMPSPPDSRKNELFLLKVNVSVRYTLKPNKSLGMESNLEYFGVLKKFLRFPLKNKGFPKHCQRYVCFKPCFFELSLFLYALSSSWFRIFNL